MADLKVVTLRQSNFRDPVATMRGIADAIEAGEYGNVESVAMVVLGDKMEVFGFGSDCEPPSIAMLLHAGFMRLAKGIEEHGQD